MAGKKKTDDYVQRVHQLLGDAFEFEYGPAQIALLEQAVALADAHNDVDLGYDVRQQLIEAAIFGGSPDLALVAFAWCVARSDEDPEHFDPENLYWKYKWMATAAVKFPTISASQIQQLLEDMLRRYQAAGIGLHPFYQTRRNVWLIMGDMAAAAWDHEQVQKLERNQMSDCEACEQDSAVDLYLQVGEYAQAMEAALPILQRSLRCAEVPHRTYARLVVPALRQEQMELAVACHRKGLRLIRTHPAFVQEASYHLLFLVLTDNLAAAVRLAQRYLPLYVACRCPLWRFDFARVMAFLCQRLVASSSSLKLRLPQRYPLPEQIDPADYAALSELFLAEARQLATAFDARNGNDYYQRQIAYLEQWPQWIRSMPL